ncbi:MAG: hypothetical protein JWO08_2743 [Verrucomicrobiaceae bacterium]|nr:hypothetical protein [Verrucomicrobiaceae bacterium]
MIHTITQTDRELSLRVGVFNTTDNPISASETLSAKDITLVSYANGKRVEIASTTRTLTDLCPGGSLGAKGMNSGLLIFPWSGMAEASTLTLRLAPFAPLSFSLDKDTSFIPLEYASTEKRSPLNYDAASSTEHLAIITMRLNSLVVKNEGLEVVFAFQNSSRFPITWKGKITGAQSRLITSQCDVLEPKAVSDSFAERIAPPGKVWTAGEDNYGWVRFPLPDPKAAEELMFCFPGYPPQYFTYNRERHAWQHKLKTQGPEVLPAPVQAVLDEERNYAALKSFWTDASNELALGRFQSFLKRFKGDAERDQRISIDHWSRLPVTSVKLSIPEVQCVKPDAKGRVKDVRVQLHYTLATLPRNNVFLSDMECDMRRDSEGGWTVEDIRYPHLQPFWLLGYTGVSHSEHFTIFYREGPDARKEVELAVQQLEKSHARLLKTGLPLQPHHAAFLVASKADFEKLTERNPDHFSGVASAVYQYRDGRVSVINKAMYINDYRFFTPQRSSDRRDRQVVIQHEMTHLTLADLTRPWTPPWLTEGVAMHYAGQCDSFSREALRRALIPEVSLPGLSRLSRLGADTENATKIMVEYQLAGETVQWLIKKYGEAAVLKLYMTYGAEIPSEIATIQGKGEASRAARLRYTRKVFARFFGDLSLEQLDAIVRSVVNG